MKREATARFISKMMRLLPYPAAIAACLLLSGCPIRSLNTLCTARDAITLPGLEGTWAEKDSKDVWKFFRKPGQKTYTLVYKDREASTLFQVRLIKLGDQLYMDTFPSQMDETGCKKQGDQTLSGGARSFYAEHSIPAHLISRVSLKGDVLATNFLDSVKLANAIKSGGVSIQHQRVEPGAGEQKDDQDLIILTASSRELQGLLLKHGDELFDKDGSSMYRVRGGRNGKRK
jgi:hypothetical protein